jgi:hypothetical protein
VPLATALRQCSAGAAGCRVMNAIPAQAHLEAARA